ncbi:hypothetical protein WJX73_003413 [Symbiochloris irregularis]|uniref:Uncharacterized protein n=1 Tax=Symbiochloris irregularis TaxID=706552 RepID=A0AAW1NT50_9CHLO
MSRLLSSQSAGTVLLLLACFLQGIPGGLATPRGASYLTSDKALVLADDHTALLDNPMSETEETLGRILKSDDDVLYFENIEGLANSTNSSNTVTLHAPTPNAAVERLPWWGVLIVVIAAGIAILVVCVLYVVFCFLPFYKPKRRAAMERKRQPPREARAASAYPGHAGEDSSSEIRPVDRTNTVDVNALM